MAKNVSWGVFLLKIALALFLLFSGLNAISATSDSVGVRIGRAFGDNEVVSLVDQIFKRGTLSTVIIISLAVVQIACGALLLLSFFIKTGKIIDILLLVLFIVWVLIIIFLDILGKGGLLDGAFKNFRTFLSFCEQLALHLLVLGAILVQKE